MKPHKNKSYEQGLDAGFKSGYEVGFEKAKEMAAYIAGEHNEYCTSLFSSILKIRDMEIPELPPTGFKRFE